MAKSKQSFAKKEKEKKRLKKQKEKLLKKEERKGKAEPDDMIAYVDEFGNITDTPPDREKRQKVKAEDIEIGVPQREKLNETRIGKLDFFDTSKGFGFIKEEGSGEKYFVHISSFEDEVNESDQVSFMIAKGQRGMDAILVKKA